MIINKKTEVNKMVCLVNVNKAYHRGEIVFGSDGVVPPTPEPQYRTISGEPYCSETGFDKMVDVYSQVSYDDGVTWETTATTPTLVEADSEDCGYRRKDTIYYTASSQLNVNLNNFTPVATAHTFSDGFGKIRCSSDVTSIANNTFSGATALTEVEIPDTVTSIGEKAFANCSGLTSINIPTGVTVINKLTFSNCRSLTSVTIPDSVTSIGEQAFYICYGLTSIVIPSGVTSIGVQAFQNCTGVTSATINATTPPTLGSANAFSGTYPIYVPCNKVSTYKAASKWIDIANRITCDYGNKAILYTAIAKPSIQVSRFTPTATANTYDSTSKIGAIEFPSDVTAIGASGFSGASIISTITIPNSVTSIGEYAFYAMGQLTSVNIPTGVTSIPNQAFRNCIKLTSITIPENVTTIGENVFAGCTSLTSITIPDSVTSIGLMAFYACSGLKNVTIGSGITTLSTWVFYQCSGLTKITVNATTPPAFDGFGVFDNTNNCPIYVPSESVNAYKTASGWSNYSTRIQAIP